METLISMISFVKKVLNEDRPCDRGKMLDEIGAYAEFLFQPLTLSMFVPTDEDGNIIKEPKRWNDYLSAPESFDGNEEWYAFNAYEEALERVLFEGFYNISNDEVEQENKNVWIEFNKDSVLFTNEFDQENYGYVIEDLVQLELKLTETAKKQIGVI